MSLFRALLSTVTRKVGRRPFRCYSSSSNVEVTQDNDGLATVVLAGAPVNSLDINLLSNISSAMKRLEEDESVRGVMLTSKFDGRVFSAGLNITDMFGKSESHLEEFWMAVQEWYLDLYGCGKPVVAAVNGHAPAGGCGMALMADYRVMMAGRTIGLNETQLGIAAPFFLADLMTTVVGKRQSELALLRGRMFSSEEALSSGVVDEVCDVDKVGVVARQQLARLAKVPQPAYQLTKYQYRREKLEYLRANREADVANFVSLLTRPGIQETLGRYLESLKQRKK